MATEQQLAHMIGARDALLAQHPMGYVTDPGKFEGESLFVLYYWEAGMNGFEDESLDDLAAGTYVAVFFVDADERRIWNLSDDTYALAIWETDTGFVMHAEWTENEYILAKEDCEGSDGEPNDESEES